MMVDTAQTMPIAQLEKSLSQTVKKISEDKQPVFIMKNNAPQAVLIPYDRYERLSELEELEEQKEIYSMVQERMSHYDASKNVSWAALRDK